MTGDLLIRGGRVIDPANGIDGLADVVIRDGKIVYVGEVGRTEQSGAERVIDAHDRLVVPGLIDIHVHFRDPGDPEEETIASGSAAAVKAGFTSVVCMPNTDPTIENETDVEYVHRKGRQARKTHVYVMGAITQGRKGRDLAEMGHMAEAGAVGFSDDGSGVQDHAVMLRALKYAAMFGKVVAQHCQDDAFAAGGVMNAGYYSTILGLPGMDALAEEAMLWRDIQLVRRTGARYHAQHISTAGSAGMIRQAKQAQLPITCEVAAHHLLLTEECCCDYDTNYKVNPPLRSAADVEALKAAIAEGLVDALVTDHAPHLLSEKELEFVAAPFGIASLECAVPLYIRALIEPGIIGWPQLIRMVTVGPARVIGIDKGTLGVGKQGDVTIIDPDLEHTIDPNTFVSKGRNCPYGGWRVRGIVDWTIVAGEVRFDRLRAAESGHAVLDRRK